ncbi:MAG: hypothetical protein IT499_12700 [Rubrivivax sp.]|nr:hypothetical protein [Rubrivivax sp.]MCL4695790.1 hypothetical protein [Burkholderiaceae bacterium]
MAGAVRLVDGQRLRVDAHAVARELAQELGGCTVPGRWANASCISRCAKKAPKCPNVNEPSASAKVVTNTHATGSTGVARAPSVCTGIRSLTVDDYEFIINKVDVCLPWQTQ